MTQRPPCECLVAEQNQVLGLEAGWPGSPQPTLSCLPESLMMLGRPRARVLGGNTAPSWLGEAAELEMVLGGRWTVQGEKSRVSLGLVDKACAEGLLNPPKDKRLCLLGSASKNHHTLGQNGR